MFMNRPLMGQRHRVILWTHDEPEVELSAVGTDRRINMRDFAYPRGMMHTMATKPVIWMGSSREDLGDFPADARREAGHQLWRVQCGDDPDDWKPFRQVGRGVREFRIQEASGAFRVMYLAERAEALYVLHCFQKKTEQTSQHDVELARRRFKALPSGRRSGR